MQFTYFALFCTPYYLRHGIENFSDYSLLLDVIVLVWKSKKMQSAVKMIILSFTLTPEVRSSSEPFVITKWTNHILFCLAYHVQIK